MSCLWVSLADCSQKEIYQLTEMVRKDRKLQIILSYDAPNSAKSYEREKEEKISAILIKLGIRPHLKGYQYLKESIRVCMEDKEELEGITKRLYPDVAKKFQTSSTKVEHAIRHAIEVAWKSGSEEEKKNFFGYIEGRRPTNLSFIMRITEYMEDEGMGDGTKIPSFPKRGQTGCF